jgi:hypothetical protein
MTDEYSLYEVVPEDACRVLEYPDERCHVHLVRLNRRPVLTLLHRLQLPQIRKPCETPITLLGNETVVGVCMSVTIGQLASSAGEMSSSSHETGRDSRETVKTDGSCGFEIASAN